MLPSSAITSLHDSKLTLHENSFLNGPQGSMSQQISGLLTMSRYRIVFYYQKYDPPVASNGHTCCYHERREHRFRATVAS